MPTRLDDLRKASPDTPPHAAHVIVLPVREERLRTIRRRLGAWLSAYLIGLQLAVAIEGTTWHWPPRLEVAWPLGTGALILALLRGAPLGYFVAFALRSRRALGASLAVGGLLGLALELVALADERTMHPAAIGAVGASAAVGAVAFLALARALRSRAASDAAILAPDLPLVGGAYVVAPLLWLAAASAARTDGRATAWGLVLLSLYGASLIGSARASRGPAAGGVAGHVAAAAAWSLCGVAPLLPTAPMEGAAVIGASATFAALHPLLLGVEARDRRVEGPALRRAMPLLVAYLALAALGPLAAALAGRAGHSPTWAAVAAAMPAWGWAEQAAAFAALGYAAAELRGRREERSGVVWAAVAAWIGLAAVAATVLRVAASATAPMPTALRVAAGVAVSMLAGRAGVAIYELQRRHARAHAHEGHGLRTAAPPPARPARASQRPRASEVDGAAWIEPIDGADAAVRA